MTGMPTDTHYSDCKVIAEDPQNLVKLVQEHKEKNDIVLAATYTTDEFPETKGFKAGYSYSVGEAYYSTVVEDYIVSIKNPWGAKTYEGTYSWTNITENLDLLEELDFDEKKADDFVLLSGKEYLKLFNELTIVKTVENYTNNYKLVKDAPTGEKQTFNFVMEEGKTCYAGVSFYDPRFYPSGCKMGSLEADIAISTEGVTVFAETVYDW